MPSEAALKWLESNKQASVDRLVGWLKIPSVSTDPAYRDQCRAAATWAAQRLTEAGLAAELVPTGTKEKPGHPIVLATTPTVHDPNAKGPHVLFYGHYDVQPADPLNLWESPPFEPVIKPAKGAVGEHIVARGAVDDKGQVASFLEALLAWKHSGGPIAGGLKITVMLEGEEESGSVNLERFVTDHRSRLESCDVCVISDTGMYDRQTPAITYGVRGLAYTEITLHAANRDLHSGQWGGRCPNPISELTKVLAGLWDKDYRVTIPGFYDSVRDLQPSERAAWKALGFDQVKALADIGMPPEADVGEKGYTALEREWARPTAEINGIWGGYTGAGAKTVIPAHASAKVSFRLVADQDPEKIRDAFFTWCKARTPAGCRWELTDHHGGWPVTVPTKSPMLDACLRALKAASGRDAALIKTGGSIPVGGLLKSALGIDTIFMGFGLDDDRVHSPNEKFELACFRLGCRTHVLAMEELGRG
ncbi:MAG: M20/M25/M40 family metallo-hydrolase [Phycisphaeraceae bacterium]|nr:M20/M25/M40 family metallo-hydrolase [Phycisphaeraceae bacterium]